MTNEEGRLAVQLTVVDPGDHLARFRGALPDEIGAHLALMPPDLIAAMALGDQGDEILVLWAGLFCDTAATLTVDPQVNLVTIAPDPIPGLGCDLLPVYRGVVLSFTDGRDAASLRLDLHFTPS